MKNLGIVAALILSFTVACVAQKAPQGVFESIRSIPGTALDCRGSAYRCDIYVRVDPTPITISGTTYPCSAFVDISEFRVKGGGKTWDIYFRIVKSNMNDTAAYEFFGTGITFTSNEPADNEFVFVELLSNNRQSHWTTSKQTKKDAGYKPKVQNDKGKECGAGDPTIANDG